jgi:putative transposase
MTNCHQYKKVKESKNRPKALKVVAKVQEKIKNTRQDFLHKLSRKLSDDNKVIVAETLWVKKLAPTELTKSIYDASFGMLLNFISYKLEREWGKFIQVDRFLPITKLCSWYGHKNDFLDLSIREWICAGCQTTHDTDDNAVNRYCGTHII